MRLGGLQKLTLLDYPGHVACTVFTPGCNLRCPFCHNASLVLPSSDDAPLDEQALLSFLKKRVGVLDGVAITGGEPLLHAELASLLEKIRALGYAIKLDTNGCFPERLEALIDAHLVDYVAMDVKNGPSHYGETVGLPGFDVAAIDRSRALLTEGRVAYEFRTTIVRPLHTEDSLCEAARWIAGAKVWYWQGFRDSGALLAGEGLSAFRADELQALAEAVRPLFPDIRLRGV